MKKIPHPIRIWTIEDAPKRYRKLFNDVVPVDEGESYVWVAVLRGPKALKWFWPDDHKVAPAGCTVRNFSAGMLFHKVVVLFDEVVYFFTDNDEDREVNCQL